MEDMRDEQRVRAEVQRLNQANGGVAENNFQPTNQTGDFGR